jgi:hypothetical protein
MSDITIQAIIAGVVTCTIAYFQYRTRAAVEATAKETKEALVATDAKKGVKLDSLAAVATQTHSIVNGRYDALVKELTEARAMIAQLMPKPPIEANVTITNPPEHQP